MGVRFDPLIFILFLSLASKSVWLESCPGLLGMCAGGKG